MTELIRSGKIPMYLVLASQIYLDIHRELRERAVDAFKSLFREVISARVDLAKHFDFHKNIKVVAGWTNVHDDKLRGLQKRLNTIVEDPVYDVKVSYYRRLEMPVPGAVDSHRVYKRSPLISGLLLYRIRAEMHIVGIKVANTFGSIMYTCHLYHAALNGRLLVRRWDDMDTAESILGTSNFYVGSHPTTLDESSKKFILQMGASASVVNGAKAREGRKIYMLNMESRSGPRAFKGTVPVSTMFMDRYVQGERRSA
ncbi:hypothetical protein IMZ48_14425 [Candidatus Bathyarchaeota archaeon]|nr:hypothetical protein [Candidatus Bathyarchaeota archaeon]